MYLPRGYMSSFGPLHTPRLPESWLPSFSTSFSASSSRGKPSAISSYNGRYGSSAYPETYRLSKPAFGFEGSARTSPTMRLPHLAACLPPVTPFGWAVAAGALVIFAVVTGCRSDNRDSSCRESDDSNSSPKIPGTYCYYLERPDMGFVLSWI